jgi:hypothetical protein
MKRCYAILFPARGDVLLSTKENQLQPVFARTWYEKASQDMEDASSQINEENKSIGDPR